MERALDITAYREQLETIRDKVTKAALPFRDGLEEIQGINNHLRNLETEEAELKENIQKEYEFNESKEEDCGKAQLDLEQALARLETAKRNLLEAAQTNTSIFLERGDVPLIGRVSFQGETKLVERTLLEARIIEMKARILERKDRLRALRASTFCLCDDEYANWFPVDTSQLETFESRCMSTLSIDDEPELPPIEATASEKIAERISNVLNSVHIDDQVRFEVLSFVVPSGHRITKTPELVMPEMFEIKQMRETWRNECLKVSELGKNRERIMRENQLLDIPNNEYYVYTELFSKCAGVLRDAQHIINGIAKVIQTNLAVPLEIWDNENYIHSKMKDLLDSVNRIQSRLTEQAKLVSMKPFGYRQQPEALIDQPLETQVSLCKELINNLNNSLLESEDTTAMIIEQIKEERAATSQRQVEPVTKVNIIEDTSDAMRDRQIRFADLKQKLVAKQRNELQELSSLINSLPDTVAEIRRDFSSFEMPQRLPISLTPLPPLPTFDPEISPSTPEEDLIQSNEDLLKHLSAKTFEVPTIRQVPRQTVLPGPIVENRKLTEKCDDFIRFLPSVTGSSSEMSAFLQTKNMLLEQLREEEKNAERRHKHAEHVRAHNGKLKKDLSELEEALSKAEQEREKALGQREKVEKYLVKYESLVHEGNEKHRRLEDTINHRLRPLMMRKIALGKQLAQIEEERAELERMYDSLC